MVDPALSPFVVQIALDVPIRSIFDYKVTDVALQGKIQPGVRVKVVFGRQKKFQVGVVVSTLPTQLDPKRLKPIEAVLDDEPLLDPISLALLRFAADYYQHPLGEAMMAALPTILRGERQALERERWLCLGKNPWPAKLGKVQKALLERLQASPYVLEDELRQCGASVPAIIREGLKEGRLEAHWKDRLPTQALNAQLDAAVGPPPLNADQQSSIIRVSESFNCFQGFCLEGITGSGKTEVYLGILAAIRTHQRQALVLVPEISLTPQTVRRFEDRFPGQLAVLHSGLTDAERLKQWRAAFTGSASIVIGTRSAIFAPLKNLGVIIIDEEHDASYKQQEGFRYSARDLALKRAQMLNIPVVLGSATPSLETLKLVSDQKLIHLRLSKRANPHATLPQLALVDLRLHPQHTELAPPSVAAIKRHLEQDNQVLIYLNRRGFAPTLFCAQCAHSIQCQHCDARMTVHLKIHKLRCHHCNAEGPIPFACPRCHAELIPVGAGTERLEESLKEWFPSTPIARLDRDVITHADELEKTMNRIRSNQAKLLVGTQMLTKGHDFPNVTCVIIVNADQGLFGTDFRASERLAQTIIQVTGRAGRAHKPGEVLIQTACPEHPLLQKLLSEGYEGFAREALTERQAHHWPPYSRLVLVRAESESRALSVRFLNQVRSVLEPLAPHSLRILGPAPALMERRAERYRAQLLLLSADRTSLQQLLHRLTPQWADLPDARRVRFSIDVDPIDLN